MTRSFHYDGDFDPPAPVVDIVVSNPSSGASMSMRALVDTGADSTVIPEDVAEELELHIIEYASLEGVGGTHDVTVHGAIVHLADVAIPLGIVAHDDECVVGRDLLTRFVTRLDGPRATVTFEAKPLRSRPPRTRR